MNTVRGLSTIAAACAALALAGGAGATQPLPVQKHALQAVQRAASTHSIDAETAAAGRAEIGRAARLVRGLPSGRGEHVAVALSELAGFSGRLTQPRALALIGELKANDDYFAKHYAPAAKTDVTDADGIVYRYFPGRCLEFHPLANFGALNARVAAGDTAGAQRLADALVARGVYQHGGGVAWEYFFPYAGGRAPWISGMAQAVGAQAFARTAALVPDEGPAFLRAASAAYATIPTHLLTSVAAGPWIRLYSFDRLVVLNAQLQAVLSLQSYADASQNPAAGALAARMQRAAAATLARFDTGYWSYYALPGVPSPLDYQQYVVGLLKRLAPTDPRFADAAARFDAYLHQPPAFELANNGVGSLRFWASKPTTVTVTTAAGPARRVSVGGGWHTLSWNPPARAGLFAVHVAAVDWAGNRASFDALPIVRVIAAAPTAKFARGSRVTRSDGLAIGTALGDPGLAAGVQRLGFRLVRFGVTWPAGATVPDPGLVAALQRVPTGLGTIVELSASPLPADDAGRAALAQYATSLAQQVPTLRYLLLAPAVTTLLVTPYAAALTALRAAVPQVAPTVAVGPLLDGAATPKPVVAALARALAATGGAPPYADVFALRPASLAAKNQWTAADVPQLITALTSTIGVAPPILLDGLAAPSPAANAAVITAAACSGSVAGIVLDNLEAASAPQVVQATLATQRGSVLCPGVASTADPVSVTFPTSLAPPAAAQLAIGCTRDCLYLAALTREDGTPVVARRGALRGGAAAQTISLPRTTLKAGSYRVEIRVVAQVNPGSVTRQTSEPLVVG